VLRELLGRIDPEGEHRPGAERRFQNGWRSHRLESRGEVLRACDRGVTGRRQAVALQRFALLVLVGHDARGAQRVVMLDPAVSNGGL
jgi:hypothetical protein